MNLISLKSYGDAVIASYWAKKLGLILVYPQNHLELIRLVHSDISSKIDIDAPLTFYNIKKCIIEFGIFSSIKKCREEIKLINSIGNKVIVATNFKDLLFCIIISCEIIIPLRYIYSDKFYMGRSIFIGSFFIILNKLTCIYDYIQVSKFRINNCNIDILPDSKISKKDISKYQLDVILKYNKNSIIYHFNNELKNSYNSFSDLISIITKNKFYVVSDSLQYHLCILFNAKVKVVINNIYSVYWSRSNDRIKI